MPLLSNQRVHTLKERQDSILLLHTFSKQLEQSRNSLPLMPTGPTPKKKKKKKKESSLKLSTSHTFGSSH